MLHRNYDFIKVKTFLIKKNFVFLYSYFFYYFFVYDFSFILKISLIKNLCKVLDLLDLFFTNKEAVTLEFSNGSILRVSLLIEIRL